MSNAGYDNDDNDEGSGSFITHIPAIIKQRRLFIIIPTIICFIAGVITAFVLPRKYESKAVLLVEAPLLPDEMATDSSGVIDQRMARIRQQVLSRPQLIQLIRQNGLYTSAIERTSLSRVIEQMRNDTVISPVNADIQQSGGGGRSTIAFSMSFRYSDPQKAQAVAQAFTEQVLQLDATKNAEQAADVVRFLTGQSDDLQKQIAELEGQISAIKSQNGAVLSNSNVMMMGGNAGNYTAQIDALQRDNRQLAMQRDLSKTSANRDPAVAGAESQLAAARAIYAESHPDVIYAKQRLAEAKKLAAANLAKVPAADMIESQIAFNNAQIAALQQARSQESARTSAVIGAQSRAPLVQEQIAQLQKRLDVLNTQYATVSSRLLNANAGKKAEDDRQGERLTLVDPPVVPESPSSPNRPLIILGGLVAGLGLGLLLIIGIELVLRPIRDEHAVRAAFGEPPLMVIPTIYAATDVKLPWYKALWPFRKKAAASPSI